MDDAFQLGAGSVLAQLVLACHRCLSVPGLWPEESHWVPQPSLFPWERGHRQGAIQRPRPLPPQLLPLCNSTDE